jgi:hypothetical protein
MATDVLGKCPVCNSDIEVLKIGCDVCGTIIEGHFNLCKFCKLTQEQKTFIDVFIKCRGNIKEVEKELGISYPTVKNKLEDVAGALGYKSSQAQADSERKKEILEKLNKGEISFDEALALLNE